MSETPLSHSDLLSMIGRSAQKKQTLLDQEPGRYILRAINAGALLTLGTLIALSIGQYFASSSPALAKTLYSFMFAWGLVMIIFLNAELATSNMMYMTVSVIDHKLSVSKAGKILLICTLSNLLGGIIFAFLFSQTGAFKGLPADHYLLSVVQGKLNKDLFQLFLEGILANVLVNIAVVGQARIKNEAGKITYILAIIFIFVFLGLEHVIANFIYFPLALFTNPNALEGFTLVAVLIHWITVWLGNFIGGGLLVGANLAWLNRTQTQYTD